MAKVTDTLLAMASAAGAGDRKTALELCRVAAGTPLQHRQRTARHRALHRIPFRTRQRLRRSRRTAARHLRRRRTHAAHHRPRRRLRRDALQQDRRRRLRRPWTERQSTSTRATCIVTDSSIHAGRSAIRRNQRHAAGKGSSRCSNAGSVPVMGGFIGANRSRHHDHHRPRRFRFFRRHLSARDSTPSASRSGPTSTAC